MDVQLLRDIGLTNAQALAYEALVRNNGNTAPAIAKAIGESRSNAYKILDKLCHLDLAVKNTTDKKILYIPSSPNALLDLVRKQTDEVALHERRLKAALPNLISFFHQHSNQPGIQFFQGHAGIKQIYYDQAKTGQTMHYIRSLEDVSFFNLDEMHALRNVFPKLGIRRYAITQDVTPRNIPAQDRVPIDVSDKAMLLTRTWIDKEDYTSPVEWTAYGNKLAIISHGQEAMGMIIESPQIAEAFRQIFKLLDEGIHRRPGYAARPLRTTYTDMPDSLRKKRKKPSK